MDNTIYVGLSRQVALQRQMDVIANNVANMNTTAFKSEGVKFSEYLLDSTGDSDPTSEPLSLVYDVGVIRNLGEGALSPTGNPLDLAIRGEGFFTLQGPDGTPRYTRNGHFELNGEGALVNSAGFRVMDEENLPITLDTTDTELTITEEGTISSSNGVVAKLKIVNFTDRQAMQKAGDSTYTTDEVPIAAPEARVQQGMLEDSNVIPVLELTNLIQLQRSYESSGKLMSDIDDLEKRAIRLLGTFK